MINGKQISFSNSGLPPFEDGFIGQIIFEKVDELLYVGGVSGWKIITNNDDLITVSGSLYSGYLVADQLLSGYIQSGYIAADLLLSGSLTTTIDNVSGTLNSSINTLSGYLQTQIPPSSFVVISGSLYNTLNVTTLSGVIRSPILYVNGMAYMQDVGTSGGFTINYSGGNNTNYLKWNYNNNNGFTLEDTDNIVIRYNR